MGSTILLPAVVTPFKFLLKMKVVIVSCLVLSLAGLSQEFLGLKLGFLKGAVAGVKKSQLKSSQQQNCRSVPHQSCRNVQETVYETVNSQQECRTEYSQSCNTVFDTRQECRTEYDEQCTDVPETNCQDVRKPVTETVN